jgi:hypothetical protein
MRRIISNTQFCSVKKAAIFPILQTWTHFRGNGQENNENCGKMLDILAICSINCRIVSRNTPFRKTFLYFVRDIFVKLVSLETLHMKG